ncbi:DUF3732 domain-containing protein [Paenibacillus sp. LMG 31461]|uniref:DUF3732 domain-containing protein n=1 Tax=Paenibacillus plantarum TaxID=2654975 RepID=A0ABX1X4I7_9BACL|nr:DUF3732 domain-containing protein [Paenibacillus plantarum]NOU63219.1 DUF3732 domain-containing protein [Paenibacillus plantarum]
MYFKIAHIILWPKDDTKEKRVISFDLNKINVITGDSQKGKSSIIPIVDYCLGSSKCTIPVGVIREKTEWFGVVIQFEDRKRLFARKEPGVQIQSGEVYINEDFKEIDEISNPFSMTNVKFLKNRLNEISNMPFLTLTDQTDDDSSGKRASFRDFSAFQFQPQHIVANPYTLFFKADTAENQQRLKNIFPLVLGAINKKTLILKQELKLLEQELQKKQRKLAEINQYTDNWMLQLKDYYSKAREYGLLKNAPESSSEWTSQIYVEYLMNVSIDNSVSVLQVDIHATERAVKELQNLTKEEVDISRDIGTERHNLHKFLSLFDSEKKYHASLKTQLERMEPVSWLSKFVEPNQECIFCGAVSNQAYEELQHLAEHIVKISESSNFIDKSYDILDREIIKRKSKLSELESSLNTIRKQKLLLEVESENIRAIRQTENEVYRYLGRLEKGLEDYALVHGHSEMQDEINILEQEIEKLRSKVNPKLLAQNLKGKLQQVSNSIATYAKFLGVENPNDPVLLDVVNLTLRKQSEGRDDFLWEIGSGANWMGYHIATLLALHDHFLGLDWNPVSQFIIIDQPSQVYFPDKLQKQSVTEYTPDDILKVQKIFTAFAAHLSNSRARGSSAAQIILIEHADEITWKAHEDDVHLVKRWRDDEESEDRALIPSEWLD